MITVLTIQEKVKGRTNKKFSTVLFPLTDIVSGEETEELRALAMLKNLMDWDSNILM